jgi:hypothetical protein
VWNVNAIKIGEYMIYRTEIGTIWIEHESGEGVEVSEKAFSEVIKTFFYNEVF